MMRWPILSLGLLLLCCSRTAVLAEELIFCGWDEVFIMDVSKDAADRPRKIWSWRARDRDDLPNEYKALFNTTDDCKSVNEGKQILITSSGGAAALVERKSGKPLWYAKAPNAHSAELLPNGRVAVAASTNQSGNRLLVFDVLREGRPLISDRLNSAHGVVWDTDRQLLWALGGEQLAAYELVDWNTPKPDLKRTHFIPLPDKGGHDLSPVPDSANLIVTTNDHVYEFNRDKRTFERHLRLGNETHVKCVSIHPTTGRVAWVRGKEPNWWDTQVTFFKPDHVLKLPGERLYKVRWAQQ